MSGMLSYKQEGNTLVINTESGIMRIIAYSPNTIRVTISHDGQFDEFSYAIVGQASSFEPKFTFTDDEITIDTGPIVTRISTKPVRIRFFNATGDLLNEDEPGFGTSFLGTEITTYKKLQGEERFIGLGEKTGNLNRRGEGYTNWNTDAFGYRGTTDPIYMSIPFYMGILENRHVYGIFLDNTYKTHFNFAASNNRFASFTVDDGDMNYYFFHDENVASIIRHYTELTGRMPMPPKWSLGLQQCRYSYYPDTEVKTLARTFREKQIPCDVIYLDIHYMDKYKVFTWHRDYFKDPKGMLDELKAQNFHTVVIVDPGIKVERNYAPFEEGLARNLFIKYQDGTNYEGAVWPGWCNFPDFTNPETRDWWGKWFQGYIDAGLDGFWNDMNEPATWGQRMPDNLEFHYEGDTASHKKGRNVYGFQMARATYEGSKALMNGKRPFILTRAGYSGVQRYSAVWTGDNTSNEEHLTLGVRLVNSLGLSGVAFAGMDVGGFDGECTPKLFGRWVSVGAFSPMFRIHSMIDSRDSEPWSYGEGIEFLCRNYIGLRYQMLPYLYSVFYEATQTGMPVARSLAIDYTYDLRILNFHYHNEYLFGPFILVGPVASEQEFARLLLPGTHGWFDLYTDEWYEGNETMIDESPLDKLPLFVKGSAIIPMQDVVQSTADRSCKTLQIHIYNGIEPAEFIYYEDDGDSYAYETGAYYRRSMQNNPRARKFEMLAAEGQFASQYSNIKILFHGCPPMTSVTVNGENAPISVTDDYVFMPPIPKFDPLGVPGESSALTLQTISFPNFSHQVLVDWNYSEGTDRNPKTGPRK